MTRPQSVAVILQGDTVKHAAVALAVHLDALRKDRFAVPEDLLRIAEAVLSAAKGRHEPTTLDALVDAVQRRPSMVLCMTYQQAADALGVSERTVQRLVASGDLPAVTVGDGAARIRASDLESYVERLGPRRMADQVQHKAPAVDAGATGPRVGRRGRPSSTRSTR